MGRGLHGSDPLCYNDGVSDSSRPTMDILAAIRRLSSLDERIKELEARKKKLSGQIKTTMSNQKQDKVESIYGYVQIRKNKEYDYSGYEAVAEAEKTLAQAKAALEAAQEQARNDGAPHKEKPVFAFYRNKAVSARAKKNRIYIRTIMSRKQAAA